MAQRKKRSFFSIFRRRSVKAILQMSPAAHLPSIFSVGKIVAFDAGPEGNVYLAAALAELDYQTEQPGWAIFPKTMPDQPQKYRVVALSGGKPVLDFLIEQEPFNIHHIQPLGDEILLVCARSHYRGPTDYEENGRIYTRNGKFVRSILLGDGIQSVQATSEKVIWTSYFDEGIFGNYGWEHPVGESGLVAWNHDGEKLYEYRPNEALDSISDCYALNVRSSEDVWFYHDTESFLVHLHLHEVENRWTIPVSESDGFAVMENHALFRGGYEERDSYHLFSLLKKGRVRKVSEFELRDQDGNRLVAERIVGRGGMLHLVSGGYLYCLDMRSLLQL